MDRNSEINTRGSKKVVALRKESVDRNVVGDVMGKGLAESLSARRAWIEMTFPGFGLEINGSLSARRAWIEIST